MLSYIIGEVAEILEDAAIIECNNLGYFVNISAATMTRLTVGERAKIHTRLRLRENDISIIGFLSAEDAMIFDALISVTGVGVRAALSIQSALDTRQIILAIITGEADQLSRAQGVGKKLAGRIVLELKDKLAAGEAYEAIRPQQSMAPGDGQAKQDAIDALLALGYSRATALRVVMEITTDGMGTEEIIRQSLKKLVVNT